MGGGVFTYIVDLANELTKSYDVYIAYGIRKQTPLDYKEYFDKDIHLIKVKNFDRTISLKKDLKSFLEIKMIAKEVKPDIIHLHSSKAGVLGRIAFSFSETPVYYTPHGFSFLMAGISRKKQILYRFIEKVCTFSGSTTIACSPGEYEEAKKISRKVKLVNNGINISDLEIYNKNTSEVKKIVTLGRATYQKNPKLFNDIATLLPNEKFIWIGDGELVNQLSSDNIEVTGWLQRNQALNTIVDSDIFVLPSLWEGLPLSLLEAMYLGKICIVSDVVGNRDVIRNGVNGFICRTPNEYADVIQKVRDGVIDTNRIIEHAREDILSVYNTVVMAKHYRDIYDNIQ